MERRRRHGNQSPQIKNSIQNSVGNEKMNTQSLTLTKQQ
jgi:hypothetical protein